MMKKTLSVSEVKEFIEKAESSFRHEECATCECYLGYVTHLKIDSTPESQQFLKEYEPDRDQIHSCLGCDPCSPGTLYANYLRKRSSRLE
jgi:hypothetical protein